MAETVSEGGAARTEKDRAAAAEKEDNNGARYSSVVYFHGMGSQRRYEETGVVIDRLDQYLSAQHRKNNSLGMLRSIKVRVEPLRPDPASKGIVGYIRTVFLPAREARPCTVRFYEAYWAPAMADKKSPWGVVRWLFRQVYRPFLTLRAPWRERQRLRRASLVALFERGRSRKEIEERDFTNL